MYLNKLRYGFFHSYFQLMAAIFDFSLFRTSGILRSSLIGLSDLENMGIAVGISLLSCIEAEIYVISHLLPVNVSDLWFLHFPKWGIIRSSLIVLPDLENMGIAVGILLLLCIEAKINDISYLLPVIGSHFLFILYPYIEHSSEYFSRVARPQRHRYSHWNFVATVYRSRDIRYFVSISG